MTFETMSHEWSGCGIVSSSDAYCWGDNSTGELGDSTLVAKRAPVKVRGGHRWLTISAGGTNACGITTEQKAYCWGNQFRGMSGTGRAAGAVPYPLPVVSDLLFAKIYAGSTSCAITTDYEAYCWGMNDLGTLGDGILVRPGARSDVPVPVSGNLRFRALSLVSGHVCGITLDERGYCWGDNHAGQLGDGTKVLRASPSAVDGGHRWREISVGSAYTCGITTKRALYCWGTNAEGQFGNGRTDEVVTTPQLIDERTHFVDIQAALRTTCGVMSNGAAFCWGFGDGGQLGDGRSRSSKTPVPVFSAF